MHHVSARGATLFLLITSAVFAVSGPFARAARPLHPVVVAFGRVALAALVLGAIAPRVTLRSLAGLTPRQRGLVLGAGALLAAHFALFLWGLDRTSIPAALSLVALEPLSVVLWAFGLYGIRPSRPEQIGVLLATTGAILVGQGAGAGEHQLTGDLLVLGAVVLFGAYVAAARGARDALPAQAYATLVYAGAAVALALALPFTPGALASAWSMPAHSAIYIVLLALFPTLIGHTAVQWAARRMSPALVALVSPGETLGGIALGAAWLGAIPTSSEITGGIIILSGTTIAILGSRTTESAAAA